MGRVGSADGARPGWVDGRPRSAKSSSPVPRSGGTDVVTVAVTSCSPIITAGAEERFRALSPFVGLAPSETADVVLVDTYGAVGSSGSMVADLAASVTGGDGPARRALALFTGRPLAGGRWPATASVLSRAASDVELVRQLRAVAGGAVVVDWPVGGPRTGIADWPGRAAGLSERESEIVLLVGHGLANAEIAGELMLGAETVKTHLRRAYRKLAVRNRTAAIVRLHGGPSAAATPAVAASG